MSHTKLLNNRGEQDATASKHPESAGGTHAGADDDEEEEMDFDSLMAKMKLELADALKQYGRLTPRQLFAEASKPLKDRDDITVTEAAAMLDQAQALIRENWRQRQANADRTDGKPVASVQVAEASPDNPNPFEGLTTDELRRLANEGENDGGDS